MNKEFTINIEAKKVDYEFVCKFSEAEYSDNGSVIISGKYSEEIMQEEVNKDINKKINDYINSKNLDASNGLNIGLTVNITNVFNIGNNIQMNFK